MSGGQPDIRDILRTCSLRECGRPHYGRGWCQVHYGRWRRTGSPSSRRQIHASPEEAFLARTEPLPWSGCLIWTGALSNGYGSIRVDSRTIPAHRYAWEREHGSIPDGLVVDHRYHCDPACCEVTHLRLATPPQNFSNRSGPAGMTATGVRNVYPDGRGGYYVRVTSRGAAHRRGGFSSIEEARLFAERLRNDLFGEYGGSDVRQG